VQPEWLSFAGTARARSKINTILRKEQKKYQREGEKLLKEFLAKEETVMSDSVIDRLVRVHNMHTPDELTIAIGNKQLLLGDADRHALKEKGGSSGWKKFLTLPTLPFGKDNKENKEVPKEKSVEKEKIDTKNILKLREEDLKTKYIMATCCHPIPGDDVLGYIDDDGHIVIHKRQCSIAARLKSSYGNRIIATEWDTHKQLSFLASVYIKGIDAIGLLNEVTQVISRQLNVNIRKMSVETIDGIFEGNIQLYVHDVQDLKSICDNLKQIRNIKLVTRVEE
jgi:GTP pyrophosphokinase